MNKNKVILDDDDEEEEMKPEEESKHIEEKQEKKEDIEKSENKEKIENKEEPIKKEEIKEKEKEKEKISSPKKEIEEKPKEKTTEKKVESTPIKKENKINNSNNTEKTNKANTEIKISKGSQQKPITKSNNNTTNIKKKNDENINNEMDIDKEYYEQERIRRIKASLEKYRVKESDIIKKKPIINPNIQHTKIHKHQIIEHKDKAKIIDSIFKSSSKKEIKSENKIEKKESSLLPKENKDKDKDKSDIINDNKKDLLNKKREREDKEKIEKKDKKNIIQKKEIKKPKPIVQKKILEDDEDEDEDESDSDYDMDKSYSEDDKSESNEESSSSESSKKKKHKPSIHKKIKPIKSVKKESGISSVKKTTLKPKGILVNELLKRWWYALPAWPPENFDTSEKLKENNLRLVKIIDWKKEPKFDKDNLEKCFELPGYKYVYLNNDGKIFDLRPKEGMPSYNNLIKLPDVKLHEYLAKALKGQLEVLEKKNSINEKELRQSIKEQLDKEEKTLARLKV